MHLPAVKRYDKFMACFGMSSPVFFPSTDKEKTPSFRLLAQLSPSVRRSQNKGCPQRSQQHQADQPDRNPAGERHVHSCGKQQHADTEEGTGPTDQVDEGTNLHDAQHEPSPVLDGHNRKPQARCGRSGIG